MVQRIPTADVSAYSTGVTAAVTVKATATTKAKQNAVMAAMVATTSGAAAAGNNGRPGASVVGGAGLSGIASAGGCGAGNFSAAAGSGAPGAAPHGPTMSTSAAAVANLATKPSLVEYKHLRFLIMDQPKASNLHLYLKECKRHNVIAICRVCEPTYSIDDVRAAGIELHELEYDDGGAPPPKIIVGWLDILKSTFPRPGSSAAAAAAAAAASTVNGGGSDGGERRPCVALHCVAGLGRAPVLVAIALIENGMDPVEAVEYIRKCRRGAINQRQLSYLQQYQRYRKPGCSTCAVM